MKAAVHVGGLLSMHALLTRNSAIMPNYSGGLLRLATDLGDRLLPAFNTPTGIPLSWVNLRKVTVQRHDLSSSDAQTYYNSRKERCSKECVHVLVCRVACRALQDSNKACIYLLSPRLACIITHLSALLYERA